MYLPSVNHNETKLRYAQILNSLLYFKISKRIRVVLSKFIKILRMNKAYNSEIVAGNEIPSSEFTNVFY